jgi:hypothetical protein
MPHDKFYLILSGGVQISSGQEGFILDYGKFQHLGSETLVRDSYLPDFSAKVTKGGTLLVVSRQLYLKHLSSLEQHTGYQFKKKN